MTFTYENTKCSLGGVLASNAENPGFDSLLHIGGMWWHMTIIPYYLIGQEK